MINNILQTHSIPIQGTVGLYNWVNSDIVENRHDEPFRLIANHV